MELAESPKVMPEMKSTKKQQQESITLVTVQENRAQRAKASQGGSVPAWRLNPKRFSSWCRLVNIHARVRRALHNMSKRGPRQTSKALLPCEIREAEAEVVRSCQREAFPGEYKALVTGKPIPTKSPLMKLNPVLHEEGCIRSNGRLQFAEYLPYDVRFPMILPRGHCVTKLVVKHYHEQANHTAGTNFVLSQINEKYWIIAAREEIREWERECNMCKRMRGKTTTQIMAPIPEIRLRFTFRPFDQTAVDYTTYSKMAATQDGLGRVAPKRGIEGHETHSMRHRDVGINFDLETFLLR